MKRIAITGARGRLARALIPVLRASGADLVLLSRQADAEHHDYAAMDGGQVPPVDALIHLAWSSVPATAEQHPQLAWTDDFPLAARILKSGIIRPGGQLIFFSTGGAVYGDTTGEDVDEGHPLRPRGYYAASKVYAEAVVSKLCAQSSRLSTCLRVTNPYGFVPDTRIPQGVIGFIFHAALTGKTFQVWGDGTVAKDYLHIDDLSEALRLVLKHELAGTYNVAEGKSRTLNDVMTIIESISGQKINKQYMPAKVWDVGMGAIRWNRLYNAVGWRPQVSFVDGLARQMQLMEKSTII